MNTRRWSVAIFTARETPEVLAETIAAAEVACADVPSLQTGPRDAAGGLERHPRGHRPSWMRGPSGARC